MIKDERLKQAILDFYWEDDFTKVEKIRDSVISIFDEYPNADSIYRKVFADSMNSLIDKLKKQEGRNDMLDERISILGAIYSFYIQVIDVKDIGI